jgi:predicted metalloprotease
VERRRPGAGAGASALVGVVVAAISCLVIACLVAAGLATVTACGSVGETLAGPLAPSSTGPRAPSSTGFGTVGPEGTLTSAGERSDPDGRAVGSEELGRSGNPATRDGQPGGDRRPLLGGVAVEEVPDLVVADLDDFWGDELLRTFGISYAAPAPPLRFDSREPLPLRCGSRQFVTTELKDNALYCPADDYVAWDDAGLFAGLAAVTGTFAVALIIAHEWGHVVQARTGEPSTVLAAELQADCYAGAWSAHAESGASRRFRLVATDLDVALAGYLDVRDRLGGDGTRSATHGSAFDRMTAFADGVEGGAPRCHRYQTEPPPDVDLPVTPADAAGGDLPLAELLVFLPSDLDKYWIDALAERTEHPVRPVERAGSATAAVGTPDTTCGGTRIPSERLRRGAWFCPVDRTVRWDLALLGPLRDRLGDFAAAFVVAHQWGAAVAATLGGATADCLTGTYAAHSIADERGPTQIRLSGGDLDEAVAGILAGGATTGEGTAFERVAEFRRGFTDGLDACLAAR